jgi:hypothetical protein
LESSYVTDTLANLKFKKKKKKKEEEENKISLLHAALNGISLEEDREKI